MLAVASLGARLLVGRSRFLRLAAGTSECLLWPCWEFRLLVGRSRFLRLPAETSECKSEKSGIWKRSCKSGIWDRWKLLRGVDGWASGPLTP